MFKRVSLFSILAAAPILLLPLPCRAEAAHLLGTVLDAMGRPLAGTQVLLKQSGSKAVSDAAGAFRLPLPSLPAGQKAAQDSLLLIKDKSLIFFLPEVSAHVRLTLYNASGREVARPIDETLARGQYHLWPFSFIDRFRSHHGVYTLKLQLGRRTFVHRLTFTGDESRSGLKSAPMALTDLAKVAAVRLDTLLVTKPGYASMRQAVLIQEDSLVAISLYPEQGSAWRTDDPPYLKPVQTDVSVTPLLTVGESVAGSGDGAGAFRIGGIPDGLGLGLEGPGIARLFMNHEITSTDSVHSRVGMPARKGAYVSEFLLDRATGSILAGRSAFDSILPTPSKVPIHGRFSRFCSGTLAGAEVGFPVPVYLTGEESPDSLSFSKDGPQAIAVYNRKAYLLPDFGKMAFENIVVVPTEDTSLTVAFALEDGPSRESQLYMYVGRKRPELMAGDPMDALGLAGGRLYAFATSGKRDEGDFTTGSLKGRWMDPLKGRVTVPMYRAGVTASQLQTWSVTGQDGKDSAFLFDRIEDGTYDRNQRGSFYFATTGDPSARRNRLGRIYKLSFDPKDPVGGKAPVLEILAQGDSAKGFVSPDNMDIGPGGKMVFCEDHNLAMPRPPAVWGLDIATRTLTKLAEVDVSAVPAAMRPDGLKTAWETSGVIDASTVFGAGAWLLNVQAHSVTGPAAADLQGLPKGQSVVQGGQLVLLRIQ